MIENNKLIEECVIATLALRTLSYDKFIDVYDLNKELFSDKAKFECAAISAFFILQAAHRKTKDPEFAQQLINEIQTMQGNLYLDILPEVKEQGMLLSRVQYYSDIFKESHGDPQIWLQKFIDLIMFSENDGSLTLSEPPIYFGGATQKLTFLAECEWNKWSEHFVGNIFAGVNIKDALITGVIGDFVNLDGPKKKEGCYIATHVYGDYNSPQVLVLRNYRDERLAKNALGRAFIKLYYITSPSLVNYLQGKDRINALIKRFLDKIIDKIYR
tara:strand:+ start:213 stop:1028 length:816 start_codon:yes stop_codon:yes gene_type:complete